MSVQFIFLFRTWVHWQVDFITVTLHKLLLNEFIAELRQVFQKHDLILDFLIHERHCISALDGTEVGHLGIIFVLWIVLLVDQILLYGRFRAPLEEHFHVGYLVFDDISDVE